jgi:hypothetical protein
MRPEVTVSGRRVTVSFDMPFMAGDECITPNHYEKTTVSFVPEVGIRLHNNFERIEIHCNGAWYTASHSQLHGPAQFLPDKEAFLTYWLGQKDRTTFESHLPSLQRMFSDQPESLSRLRSRHVEMLQQEADTAKAALGASIVASTRQIMGLEMAIAKVTGVA